MPGPGRTLYEGGRVAGRLLHVPGACIDLPEGGILGFGGGIPAGWGDYEPAWSPLGTEIAVSSTRPDGGLAFDIHLLDLTGQYVGDGRPVRGRAVVVPRRASDRLQQRRDGEHLRHQQGRGRASRLSDRHPRRRAYGLVARGDRGSLSLLQPGVSPELNRMSADGSDVVQLTTIEVGRGSPFDPAWSPCGGEIAFSASDNGTGAIFLMSADGSDVRPLTNAGGNDYGPSWSPDCSQIAFASDRDGVVSDIWTIATDGSRLTRLTVRE